MEYQVSNRAKKVTLGLAVLGLIMLVFGFFQQKDYVYVGELIDEHSLTIKYNGEVTAEKEKTLQEKIKSTMEAKGYSVTIEKVDAHHHDHADGENIQMIIIQKVEIIIQKVDINMPMKKLLKTS